jgi:hypothetical protein
MKNNEQFSEQVLEQTLLAVRREKRRRNQRRVAVACLLAAGLAVLLRPAPQNVSEDLVQSAGPDRTPGMENVVVFSTASRKEAMRNVRVFSTADCVVEINRIGTEEVNVMLAGIPHGFYETPDGKTHFWSPALAVSN